MTAVYTIIVSTICNTSKVDRLKPQGLVTPLQQTANTAQAYNIDFVGPLSRSSQDNHMLMICVERFSRRVFLY